MADNSAANNVNVSQTTANANNGNDLRADLDSRATQNLTEGSSANTANAAQVTEADLSSELNNIAPAAGQPFTQGTAAPAVNVTTPSTTLAASGIATHTLVKPAAGQTEVVHVAAGEVIATQFDPNSADLSMSGQDLVLSFNDGSKIVLDGFAQDMANLPTIALPNGALVAGGVIVAQLQGTNEELFNLETAAGAAAQGGGGQFIYSDDLGSIIDLLEKLPPIPFTSLQFGQPDPAVTVAPFFFGIGGTFIPPITTTYPVGGVNTTVAGGFEDWQPNQHVGDLNQFPMALNILFTPNSNEVVDTITISGVPAGVQLFYKDATGTVTPLTLTGGSVTLQGDAFATGQVLILPNGNKDSDIPLTISLLIRNPDTGETAVISQNTVAVVDAVADLPTLTSAVTLNGTTANSGTVSGTEGQPINLNIATAFTDNDGSEVHTIVIAGVPGEWTMTNNGGLTFAMTTNPDGTVTYTAVVGSGANVNVSFDPNNWSSKANGDAQLTVIARATETVTDGEITTANNVAEVKTTFGVNIAEDVPVIVAVTTPAAIPEALLLIPGVDQVGGTITVDFKTDNNVGNVKLTTDGLTALNLTSHGQPLTYALSADGKTITATDPSGNPVFTVVLNPPTNNGGEQTVTYTFTLLDALDHPPGAGPNNLNIPVKFVAIDQDGDDANGTFTVTVVDDLPTVGAASNTTDETNNSGVALNGTLPVNFGADGAGTVTENNQFTSGGSKTGGALTSNGVLVGVTLEGGQYVGKANGVTVFTMDIKANGTYTFTQFGPLDHANGSDPNDVINLNFGYTATDYDGDSVSGTVTINVRDDAPLAVDDTATLNNVNVATGNVMSNDVMSKDVVNLLKDVTAGGTTKSFATPDGVDANGKFVLVNGTYGQLKVYENGNYTYTYNDPAHSGTNTEVFSYTLVDSDGDTSVANLTLSIIDNGANVPPAVIKGVDETTDINLAISDTIVAPGATTYLLGDVNGAAGFSASGSMTGGVLTLTGVPIVVTLVGNKYIGSTVPGPGGSTEVFTLEMNSNGTYTFILKTQIDHANTSDPNDVINLIFTYSVKDAGGDIASNTITINVADDAPIAVPDVGTVADNTSVATGNVITNDIMSKDIINVLKDASFGGTTKSFATPDGNDSMGNYVLINGAYGQLKLYEHGQYVYTYNNAAFTGNHTEVFNYTLVDRDGDTSQTTLTLNIIDNGPGVPPAVIKGVDETTDIGVAVSDTVVVAGATQYMMGNPAGVGTFTSGGSQTGGALTSNGVQVVVTLVGGKYVGMAGAVEVFTLEIDNSGKYTFTQKAPLDHANGSDPNDIINLTFAYTAKDADGDAVSNTITINVRDDAPVAVADVATLNNVAVATGNVMTNDVMSKDVTNLLKDASFGTTTKSFSTPDGVDAGGKYVLIAGAYGQLKIYENGNYTYTYNSTAHSGTLTEQFNYTLIDKDGDTSQTTLTLNIIDNGPGVPPAVVKAVDETTDIGVAVTDTIVVTGATQYALGNPAGSGVFTSGGSQTGGALTSNGVPVVVTLVGGKYVGMAGAKEVFTLEINPATGQYKFTLKSVLDHANGSDPNDIINLTFAYTAKDNSNNAVTSTITVNVADDAPVAVADTATLNNQLVATGNVITNDTLSKDATNLLKSVSFGGTTKSFATPDGVDASGKYVLVNGAHGLLKIYENGNYTYTYDSANNTGNLTEQFNYTLVDFDGDTSSTTLTLNIVDTNPGVPPAVFRAMDETFDIGKSLSGTITVSNATTYSMGSPTGAAVFASSGSLMGGNLTSNGVTVNVSLVNGKYVGMAGTKEIFTLEINPTTGLYTFTLKGPLDHANGSDPNDIINLRFSYSAKDNDGDAVTSFIEVAVADDAPQAVADVGTVVNYKASGDLFANDSFGNDTITSGLHIKDASFGSTTKVATSPDGVDNFGPYMQLQGTYGTLRVYLSGSMEGKYQYSANPNSLQPGNGGQVTDQFKYTIQDRDGDTSQTTLTINVPLPKLTVGENTSDFGNTGTPYHVGIGQGEIIGTGADDILIGDIGGTRAPGSQNYNIALVLDTSNSMNAQGGNGKTKLQLLKESVQNLLADYAAYTGGTIKVHFVTFNNNVQSTGTYTITNPTEYAAAIAFLMGLVATGETNYEAPLQSVINWWQGATNNDPIAGGKNFTYFVSDGEPNRYLNNGGQVVVSNTGVFLNDAMKEILGYDGSNEVATLKGLSEVVAVGVDSSSNITRLDLIDSDGSALNVTNPTQLDAALQGSQPVNNLGAVGNDVINGGDGNDLIFGDTVNTDVLAKAYNLNLPEGSGWKVFAELEANHGWSRTTTINYIRSHIEELGQETIGANGSQRDGGHDTLSGGAGNDVIFGQNGNDTIYGGAGNDILIGGTGNNTLYGGAGTDTFMFLKGNTGYDTIKDYNASDGDRLDISDLLSGSSYAPGSSDINDYVKIDDGTGKIYVDKDGFGFFHNGNVIGQIDNINALGSINVILNDNEGVKNVIPS